MVAREIDLEEKRMCALSPMIQEPFFSLPVVPAPTVPEVVVQAPATVPDIVVQAPAMIPPMETMSQKLEPVFQEPIEPTHEEELFRMRHTLFVRIWNAVEQHDEYFVQKRNAAGVLGLSSLQKITAAFQMLTYGVAADATNDYVRIGESTAIESLRRFVNVVVEVFGDEYLRSPNEDDTATLLSIGESRGFPAEGQAPKVNTINNNEYTMGYYLADGIYPSWATIVKSIPDPQGNKKKYFATAQEACRKDVERAFGVLQSRFAIVRGPARFWDEDTIGQIMRACVIMHNMILEDERDEEDDLNYDGVEKR
ncbi:uncharacterized protein [Setaria viridis]|uniref:uncharacterized protein n=1 Tax=Setaria viridis TaxID=4556 RepID=UPI003B3AD18F